MKMCRSFLSVCLSVCPSVCLSVFLSLSVCLSDRSLIGLNTVLYTILESCPQVPPAKRVNLVHRDEPPAHCATTVRKPGLYTVYVTATHRWTGSEAYVDPSEQPIAVTRFCIPAKLYMFDGGELLDETTCDEVSIRRILASADCSRCAFCDLQSACLCFLKVD